MTIATAAAPWHGTDRVAPSSSPPAGLTPAEVPMFVALGFDDNGDADGMEWATALVGDHGGRASFFVTASAGASSPAVAAAWRAAAAAGHELGNHTVRHADGVDFDDATWADELRGCAAYLVDSGIVDADRLHGFRAPFLRYNDAALATARRLGYRYDCSIEEGFQADQDGTDFCWPYTLDAGSPGHATQVATGERAEPVTSHPGLWELPAYVVVVPPDERCRDYGVVPGLRARLHTRQPWFDPRAGKITGFDYNLWAGVGVGGFAMTPAEVVATLTYTFDQRLAGNRAPLLLGAHSAYYVTAWDHEAPSAPSAIDRRFALEDVVAHVRRHPDVRLVGYTEVLDWLRAPTPLSC